MNYLEFPFEIKQVKDDGEFFTFEGLASTFNNVDLVDDVVAKGAFLKSLGERTPVILWQHNTNEPIGMPSEISENDEGLFIKARLPKEDDLVRGRVMPQMRVGSITKMSIGYSVKDSDNNGQVRVLKEIDLFEVSLVTFPANPKANVTGFKNKDGKMFSIEDVQNVNDVKSLRDFFKNSDVFTKQAREHIINKFTHLSDSNADDCQSDSDDLKAAVQSFKNLNTTLKN
jgi:HK97 family phage prohead protease